MCGRYTLSSDVKKLARWFDLPRAEAVQPSLFGRFNVAPSQLVAAVRLHPRTGELELTAMRWGLIPAWADDPAIGNRLINARAESIATKPAFRDAWRHRRCLVPSDGFYEWQRRGKTKQPYLIRMADESPMAFAGVWETWRSPEGESIESCAVITTDSNELVAPIHDRMPVIIDRADYERYLRGSVEEAAALLRPYPAELMIALAVSMLVNDPKHEDPRCAEPVENNQTLWGSM